MPRLSLAERVFSRFLLTDAGCWEWCGVLFSTGYGKFDYFDGGVKKQGLAHRLAYGLLIGPIAKGLQLDHLCKNRRCINPDHLEPVTPQENNKRSESPSAKNMIKTHCLNGHEFTSANTYITPDDRRNCRICRHLACKRSVERKKHLAAPL